MSPKKPPKAPRSPLRLCAMEDCRNYLRAPSLGRPNRYCCEDHAAWKRKKTKVVPEPRAPRPCAHCGELFASKGHSARYCGTTCSRAASNRRHAANAAAIRAELEASKASGKPAICPVCCELPHRLTAPCPRCGLKPAPLPPVRYEVAMSSPSDWSHAP